MNVASKRRNHDMRIVVRVVMDQKLKLVFVFGWQRTKRVCVHVLIFVELYTRTVPAPVVWVFD